MLRTACRAGFNDFCIEGVARRVVVLVGSAILRFCGASVETVSELLLAEVMYAASDRLTLRGPFSGPASSLEAMSCSDVVV